MASPKRKTLLHLITLIFPRRLQAGPAACRARRPAARQSNRLSMDMLLHIVLMCSNLYCYCATHCYVATHCSNVDDFNHMLSEKLSVDAGSRAK
jgi:hypothetical protein